MKKLLIGFLSFTFLGVILLSLLMGISMISFNSNDSDVDLLTDVDIKGYEIDGKVYLSLSGDAEVDGIKGKMNKRFDGFIARKDSEEETKKEKKENEDKNKKKNKEKNKKKASIVEYAFAKGNPTATKTWKALKECGLTDEAAAGVMGNIQQECSFNAAYASGGDYGLFNMNMGRANSMKKFAAKHGKSWTDPRMQVLWMDKNQGNRQFKAYSGHGLFTYSNGTKTWWKKKITWKQFKNLSNSNSSKFKGNDDGQGKDKTTVDLAAHIFCNVFERAGIPRMDLRRKYAKNWYREFVGKYPTGGGVDEYDPIEIEGTIKGDNLDIEAIIGTHIIKGNGTFKEDKKKQEKLEKKKKRKFKSFHVINANGGEEETGNFIGGNGKLIWPCKKFTVERGWAESSRGSGKAVTGTGGEAHYHQGVDIVIKGGIGAKIIAPADGIMTKFHHGGFGNNGGNMLTIKHDKHLYTMYLHLHESSLKLYKKGKKVKKGQVIAKQGGSTTSAASDGFVHLHFEVRTKKEYGWNGNGGAGASFEKLKDVCINPVLVLPKLKKGKVPKTQYKLGKNGADYKRFIKYFGSGK